MQKRISPFLDSAPLAVKDIDCEICLVANIVIDTAEECLPKFKNSHHQHIRDFKLSALCKLSKIAWKKWKIAGRPTQGPLYTAKKETARAVKKHVYAGRARRERANIQKRDKLFREQHAHRFRVPKSQSECSRLLNDLQQPISDPAHILDQFRSYFSDLASSSMQAGDEISSAADRLTTLEEISVTHDDQVLDTEVDVDEVQSALRVLKLGRSKGADGLRAEYLVYGGPALTLWLKTIE